MFQLFFFFPKVVNLIIAGLPRFKSVEVGGCSAESHLGVGSQWCRLRQVAQPRNPSSECYLAALLLKMAAIGLVQMLIEAAEYLDRRERGKVTVTLLSPVLCSCMLLSQPIPHRSV